MERKEIKIYKSLVLVIVLLLIVSFTMPLLAADFFVICGTGTPEEVQKAIDEGADVNARNKIYQGYTPLHYVISFNRNPEAIIPLLNAGADVNAKDNFGNTALLLALRYNKPLKVIKALLEAGANVNA